MAAVRESGASRMGAHRYGVNCSILFTELPWYERPAAASAAGFDAVEFWWPFRAAVPPDAEVEAFVAAIGDAGVRLVGLNLFAGDMSAGGAGAAVLARTGAGVPRQPGGRARHRRTAGLSHLQRSVGQSSRRRRSAGPG